MCVKISRSKYRSTSQWLKVFERRFMPSRHKDSNYNGKTSPMFECIEIGVGAAHVTRPHSMAPPFMLRERERHHNTSGRNEKGERAPLPCMGMQFVSARARIWCRTFASQLAPGRRHIGVPLPHLGAFLSTLHIWLCVCLHTAGVIWSIAGFLWETQVVCRVRWLGALPLTLCGSGPHALLAILQGLPHSTLL